MKRPFYAAGLVLGVAIWLVVCFAWWYSGMGLWWETEYPDGSQPITWRSLSVILGLLVAAQLLSRLVVRRFAHSADDN